MSAMYSLRLNMLGSGLCEDCFQISDVAEYEDKIRNRKANHCVDCAVKKINGTIDSGEFPKLDIGDKQVEISHAGRGGKHGELILYEKLAVRLS